MLILLMKINNHQVGIDVKEVVEVIPNVPLFDVEKENTYELCQGSLGYHGKHIPVFDLSDLLAFTPTEKSLSSRIIVSEMPNSSKDHKIGLIAAHLTSVMTIPLKQEQWRHAEQLMSLVQQDGFVIHLLSVTRIMDCYYKYRDVSLLPKIGAPV
ncbi:hypothetical protein MNBD_GAMMA16-1291 [hydrothermal vent metagenome]|uniref:CheW-like domain-containing protein n=1 Tax=hydrothermal vent metagenome TaxID=652676 RepID=A0A3B1A1W2_9ZZZZ